MTADAVEEFQASGKGKKGKGTRLHPHDRAISPSILRETPEIFDLWLAARVKTAQLPLGINQKSLWQKDSEHYCLKLDAVLPL